MFESVNRDIRYAVRSLLKSPVVSIIAFVSLALAIGANTAIFSVIHAVLIRPLPYENSEELVVFWNSYSNVSLDRASISPGDFADYKQYLNDLQGVAAFTDRTVNLTSTNQPQQLYGFLVSPDLFSVIGIRPLLGRAFKQNEGREGENKVVLLSHHVWQSTFGSDPNIIGKTIELNDNSYSIIGVMGRGIRFPDSPTFLFADRADLWMPLSFENRAPQESRGNQYLRVVGRLKTGSSLERLRASLESLGDTFRRQYPNNYGQWWKPVVLPFRDQVVGDVKPALLVIFGAVALVLLIACANVAHLMMVRAASRQREIAVRLAMGARRIRIVRLFLIESILLSSAGGVCGIILAAWGIEFLVRLAPSSIPQLENVSINAGVLFFTALVCLGAAVLFGTIPALKWTRPDLQDSLKEGSRGTSRAHGTFRNALIITEVALAAVVLISAVLLLKTFLNLQNVDTGFRTNNVLTMFITLPSSKYQERSDAGNLVDRYLERIDELPGVESAAAALPLPFSGDTWGASFDIEHQPVPEGGLMPHASFASITPDYFSAMGIPILAGRDFTARDAEPGNRVAIVDALLAKKYWPNESAIGKRINLDGAEDSWASIVGIAGHIRNANLREEGEPQAYIPYYERPVYSAYVIVRTDSSFASVAPALRQIMNELDPDQPIARMRPMTELLSQALARERFALFLLSLFAASATILAACGIYGVLSYAVSLRTQEIGIRMSLGARTQQILGMVLGHTTILVLAGVALGLLLFACVEQLVAGLLYGISSTDPSILALTGTGLLATGILAALIPARRASKVNPVTALKYE